MRLRFIMILVILQAIYPAYGQKIIDPCFASVTPLGFFDDSDDVVNVCLCGQHEIATDLMEWDGTRWVGALRNTADLKPPAGCNTRAVWMGSADWTEGGEAFAMRLDKALIKGETYSFTFTYAKNGTEDDPSKPIPLFGPSVYTGKYRPTINDSHKAGQLVGNPGGYWTTSTITFTANEIQEGDNWIVLHTVETSGIVLSNCIVNEPIDKNFLATDTTICAADNFELKTPIYPHYTYQWSNGEKTPYINVTESGWYNVEITNGSCTSKDSVYLEVEDCEVRLTMPNIFTPNDDEFNQTFLPMEHNYVDSGAVLIYNRWGEKIFSGDLFRGWDGNSDGKTSSSGVYYYKVIFIDKKGTAGAKRGVLTLAE